MTRQEILLVQLGEELSEMVQECSKCLRFGSMEVYPLIGKTNAVRVMEEFADVVALIEMLQYERVLPYELKRDLIDKKKDKVEELIKYSQKLGRVT